MKYKLGQFKTDHLQMRESFPGLYAILNYPSYPSSSNKLPPSAAAVASSSQRLL
jgi:hypothetical protein